MNETLKSPQVIAALITSTVAIMLALIPVLMRDRSNENPTPIPPTATAEIVASATFTSQPGIEQPTNTLILTDTDVPTEEATATQPEARATEIPPTDAPPANIVLFYDDVSFTVHNQSSQTLSLSNLRFQSSSGNWNATQWGEGLVNAMPANNCLRMRDSNSGQRQPPSICGNLLGLQLVSGSARFWMNTSSFDVLLNGNVIATCAIADETCLIYMP